MQHVWGNLERSDGIQVYLDHGAWNINNNPRKDQRKELWSLDFIMSISSFVVTSGYGNYALRLIYIVVFFSL